jgi:hypothetical protein
MLLVHAYNSGLLGLVNGSIAFAMDPVYAALLTEAYVPDVEHVLRSDVIANEVTDTGYAAKALTGKSVELIGIDVVYDSDDILFGTQVTISARWIVFIKGTVSSPTPDDKLIWYADPGLVLASEDAEFILRTPDGLYQVAPSTVPTVPL